MTDAQATDATAIRVIVGRNMVDALDRLRATLGADAMILQTRQLTRRGWTGAKNTGVEITAMLPPEYAAEAERDARQRRLNAAYQTTPGGAPRNPPALPMPNQADFATPTSPHMPNRQPKLILKSRDALQNAAPRRARRFTQLFEQLVEQEVPATLAAQCVQELARGEELLDVGIHDLHERAVTWFANRFVISEMDVGDFATQKVRAIVGPPGVGKTTTVAKLAAWARFERGREVALLSIDREGIAATKQLAIFAEALGVPWCSTDTPRGVQDALLRFHQCDLILLDTPGKNPADVSGIRDLRTYFERRIDVTLLLDATARECVWRASCAGFADLRYDQVILTRLDVPDRLGNLAALPSVSVTPLSFVTTGRLPPENLITADSRDLALRFLSRAKKPAEPEQLTAGNGVAEEIPSASVLKPRETS